MKKTLLSRYLLSVIFLLLFSKGSHAICTVSFTSDTVNIACGDSFTFGGVAYYAPVTQTDTFIGTNGCDSVVTLYLLSLADTSSVIVPLCAGDSTFLFGNWVKTPGPYDTLITSGTGCSMVLVINIVQQAPLPPTYIYNTICHGDSLLFNGVYVDTASVYTAHINPPNTCDSTVILTLTIQNPLPPTHVYDTICQGDSVLFNGIYVDTAGIYTANYYPENACDSMVILSLALRPLQPPVYFYDTICQGDSVLFNGVYEYNGGVYTSHFNPPNICDSAMILTLVVKPVTAATFTWDSLFQEGFVGGFYDSLTSWCSVYFSSMFLLAGGGPPGGYYSGMGVSNDTFYARLIIDLYYADTIYYTYVSANGCASTADGIILGEMCEGVQEVQDQYILNLYPNPARNYLTVEFTTFVGSGAGFTANSRIEIVDVLGRVVITERIKGPVTNTQVDIHSLSNGLYFLRIVDDTGVESEGRPACPVGRFSVIK